MAKAYEYILELQQKIAALSQGHNIYDKEEVDLLIQERNNFKSEVNLTVKNFFTIIYNLRRLTVCVSKTSSTVAPLLKRE